MESDGPYFHRCGTPGEKSNCTACAYEEGRKSMEKEFKELLSIAEMMCDDIDYGSDGTAAFVDWKKARGIE